MKKHNIESRVFWPTVMAFIILSVILLVGGQKLYDFLTGVLSTLTHQLGSLYIWIYILNFGFLLWLAFSKFGKVRLGKPNEKPEYSNFAWFCMVFTTGIDASIMIMSLFEPIRYLQNPPFGIEPFSNTAYDFAHMYGQFHWGPMAWMMYVPATIVIAYSLYVKKSQTTRISSSCVALDGNGRLKSRLRDVLDIFVVFGIMGGIGASIGLEIPVISEIVSQITGLNNSIGLKLAMLLVLLLLFGTTVYLGLDKGIQVLSSINVYVVLAFLAIVLFAGPTRYIIDSQTNSMGLLASNFVRMSTYTDPNHLSGFPQQWTTFYWGWWLAYMPVMGLFVARISRGRTIKQVILGQVTWGSLGCMSFFAIMGGYSLHLQKSGAVDLAQILDTQGQEAAIGAVISTLPFKTIMLVVYSVTCFIFLATTVSSSAYVLASMTSKELTGYQQPARWNRMLWAIVFILFSAGIIVVGGFETIQVVCVIAGFPLVLVCFVLIRSILVYKKTHRELDEKI